MGLLFQLLIMINIYGEFMEWCQSILWENLLWCHFINCAFHMVWPRTELGSSQWEAGAIWAVASAILRQCCQVYMQQWWKIHFLSSNCHTKILPYETAQIAWTSIAEIYIILIYRCHWPAYAEGNVWIKVHMSAYFLPSQNWQSRLWLWRFSQLSSFPLIASWSHTFQMDLCSQSLQTWWHWHFQTLTAVL